MHITKTFLAISLLFLSLISNASLINFVDNGRTTFEYKDDGTIVEWLDVTETFNRSFDVINADLADSLLTLSDTNDQLAFGWDYASIEDVTLMVNNFYSDLGFVHLAYSYNGLNSYQERNELFIALFGDTEKKRYSENGYELYNDFSGDVYGKTSSINTDSGDVYIAQVFDGDYHYNRFGLITDTDDFDAMATQNIVGKHITNSGGSWLKREVTSVPEPSTSIIFIVAIFVLLFNKRVGLIKI